MKGKKKKQEEPEKRKSKRKFEERDCIDPNCVYFRRFTPTWATQTYCCRQCQIDNANGRVKEKNRTTYKEEKELREFNKRLAKLYNFFMKDDVCQVYEEFLRYEGINLAKCVSEQQNPRTNQPVKWFYEYGTEIHPSDSNWFIIHKRPKQ